MLVSSHLIGFGAGGKAGITVAVTMSAGTLFGTLTNAGGNAAAIDGVTGQNTSNCASRNPSGSGFVNYVGVIWTAPKAVNGFTITGPSNTSFKGGGVSTTYRLEASQDTTNGTDGTWTTMSSGSTGTGSAEVITVNSGIDTSADWKAHRINFDGGGGSAINLAEMTMTELI